MTTTNSVASRDLTLAPEDKRQSFVIGVTATAACNQTRRNAVTNGIRPYRPYRLPARLPKPSSAFPSLAGKPWQRSLTLDDDASPLSRLRREILDVLAQHKVANVDFQTEVRSTLDTFKTKREEEARSTLHGVAFEDRVGEFLENEAARVADVCEHVGVTPGRSQRKYGDYVIELGPESASPGARIVFEAKANKRYTLKNAVAELGEARANRDAQVGVFVFDRASAPQSMEPLHRVGSDVFVVWDGEDLTTDIYLKVAFGLARTLAHRACVADSTAEADFVALDALIEEIAAHVTTLESIEKSARGVKKHGENILASAQGLRDAVERQVEALRGHVSAVRGGGGKGEQ